MKCDTSREPYSLDGKENEWRSIRANKTQEACGKNQWEEEHILRREKLLKIIIEGKVEDKTPKEDFTFNNKREISIICTGSTTYESM